MLDETQLRDGLGRMIRVDAADVPQSLVDSLIDEPSLGAAYAKAADASEVAGTETVILYFQAFLGRLPAPAGLDFWTNGFNDGSQSLADLKSFFTGSDEFQDRFDDFLSVEGVVTELFRSGLGREGAPEGIQFWSERGEALIDRNLDAGQTQEEAFNNAVADLAEAFVEAAIEGSPTEVARVDVAVDQLLVEAAASGDGVFDTDSSLYKRFFAQVAEDPNDPTTTILALNSVAGTDEVVPFAAEGSTSEIDTLRLTGDASVRIDLTDPNEQLEGIDIDGSANGVLEAGEVQDGITFDEQDQAFRDAVDVSNFDIIDAHPRGDALLNPNATDQGFTGNLYVDGTGFNGSGTELTGNIVLGGYGEDEIITGNGNDFVSSGGLDDVIKTGRNADFIYQELSRLDDAFSGDDGEIDGGATSDADGTDSDWLLLEASDDEEPVSVSLATGLDLSVLSDALGDLDDDLDLDGIDEFIDALESLLNGGIANEDAGFIQTRLGNDSAAIQNIENVNASGNFYKFFDRSITEVTTSALVGFGDTFSADDAAGDSDGFRFFVNAGDGELNITRQQILDFNDGAGVQSVDDLRALTQAAFDEEFGEGEFTVVTADDTDIALPEGVTLNPTEGPVDATGPVVFAVANNDNIFTADPSLKGTQNELARGIRFADPDTTQLVSDLFFGDNRDFSQSEVEFRVPGLSPGVTAQMILVGSEDSDDIGSIDGVQVGNVSEDGGNILIAGYDNDFVAGLGDSDLLMGGDLEFLLTHRHNPNLFDTTDGSISVNGGDGIADDGQDTLVGGEGVDNLVWEADDGAYYGDSPDGSEAVGDALWLTPFSVGRLTDVVRSTDGSTADFLGVDGAGQVATQDLTGTGEEEDENAAVNELTTDGVLRFDLGMGAGQDFQGNGDQAFRGDLAGADRTGNADQTNYADGFGATLITDIEDINASGLGAIDYLAAVIGDPDGTDLTFENQQNYRGTNADLDLRGIDLDSTNAEANEIIGDINFGGGFAGTGFDGEGGDTALVEELELSFTDDDAGSTASYGESLNGATFNGWSVRDDDGNAVDMADLVFTSSGDLEDANQGGRVEADNRLFASFGDDTLEGRGGDDLLEGREGDDLFIQALSDSVSGGGDNVDIIARRQDIDGDGPDGILDTDADGETIVGRDFRPGQIVIDNVATPRFQLQPIGGEDDTFNIPNGTDNWETFISLTFELSDGTVAEVTVGPGLTTATQVAAALQGAANLPDGLTFTAAEAVDDPDTADDPDTDPGFLDAVLIEFNPLIGGANLVGEPVAEFTSPENAGFGLLGLEPGNIPVTTGDREDDEIVFRSYQNRNDDESIPDRQASLGLEAYAEDVIVGVQDGTTKLVEGQEYRIHIEDLKENDTVSVKFNGTTYTRTVDFDGSPNSETTAAFLQAFAQQINAAIAADPHSRDGGIVVEAVVDSPGADDGQLVVREASTAIDNAEHVFIQFPEVSVANASGGDRGNYAVKETSDSSTVIFEYDYRDASTDGLNRGVGTYEQRGDLLDDRFITFEDTSGINRAILQDADDAGETVRGLDVTVFDQPGAPDFRTGDDAFEDGAEVILQDQIDDDPERPSDNPVDVLAAYIPANDGTEVVGNTGGRGEPTNGAFSALNGDDNLRGGTGIDTLDGNTGDDRLTAGRNSDLLFNELYDGGQNIVVNNATGQVVESDSNSAGLSQVPNTGQTLLKFIDTLIVEEGTGANGENTARAGFDEGALFSFTVTDVAEDFGIDGRLGVDEDADGDFEHTATVANMEVVRTLSDTQNDSVSFSGLNQTADLNDDGDIADANENQTRGVQFDAFTGAVAFSVWTQLDENNLPVDQDAEGEPGFGTAQDDFRSLNMGQIQGFENVSGTSGVDTFTGRGQQDFTGGLGDDFYLYRNFVEGPGGAPADSADGGADIETLDTTDDEADVVGTSGMDVITFGRDGDLIGLAPELVGGEVLFERGTYNAGSDTFTLGSEDDDNEALVQIKNANGDRIHVVVTNAFDADDAANDFSGANLLGGENPTARDDSATVEEDGPAVTFNVLDNDSDPQDGTPTVQSFDASGTTGTVTDNGGGSFTYDPNGQFEALTAGQTGSDSFTYTVVDSDGNTDTATVNLTINGADEPPLEGTRITEAGTTQAVDGVAENFIFSIDNSGGLPAVNANFAGDATINGFNPAEDTITFENVAGSNVTEADFFGAGGVGDELFEQVFEGFDPVQITYGINPAIDPNASASILIDGVTQLNTNTADDPALDFIEVV